MIIGDTKGHDDMCCHYNSHSGTICCIVGECNIYQAYGNDPNCPCTMVEQQPIDDVVTAAMIVIESQKIGEIWKCPGELLPNLTTPCLPCPVFFDIPTDGSKYGIWLPSMGTPTPLPSWISQVFTTCPLQLPRSATPTLKD